MSFAYLYYDFRGVVYLCSSNRSRCSTISSAALPFHLGGIAPFFHCPAINRASARGSLLGSVPMSSLSGPDQHEYTPDGGLVLFSGNNTDDVMASLGLEGYTARWRKT